MLEELIDPGCEYVQPKMKSEMQRLITSDVYTKLEGKQW